jgi:hypothetical protein
MERTPQEIANFVVRLAVGVGDVGYCSDCRKLAGGIITCGCKWGRWERVGDDADMTRTAVLAFLNREFDPD